MKNKQTLFVSIMFNQYYSGKRIKDIVALLAEKGIKILMVNLGQ